MAGSAAYLAGLIALHLLTLLLLALLSRYPEFGGTPICPICTWVKSFNEYYYFKIVSIFKMWSHAHDKRYYFWQGSFCSLSKRKRKILHYAMPTFSHIFFALVMTYYTLPCFFWQNLHQRQEFWVLQFIPHVLGTKNEIYYSSVTIHCYYSLSLFTCYCSWHCSLWIFAYLKGVVPYISSKF